MKLKRKTNGDGYHFIIYDRQTDEEGVLTFTNLLLSINIRVTLFLSNKILTLIGNKLKKLDVNVIELNKDFDVSINQMNDFININNIDLIYFPYFDATTNHEFNLYKKFIKKQPVFVHINSYKRWISKYPPIIFNGWKIIKRFDILDWIFCKLTFKHFSGYVISDIHINSDNPLKQILQSKTRKPVFDIPFKIMASEYKPPKEYNSHCFVIPGAIDNDRREYFPILNVLTSKQLINEDWKLILLGRPIGLYGEKVISYCQKINRLLGKEKFLFFNNYISYESFDYFMELSDFILAPVNPGGYLYGKDSGALYDVFRYNKFGIFDKRYFYSSALPETKCIITYSSNSDLQDILTSIVNNKFDTSSFYENLNEVNTHFNIENYSRSLRITINNIYSNERNPN